MATLSELRSEIIDVLTAEGFRAFGYLPERVAPPAAVVMMGDRFIDTAPVYKEHTVRYDVVLFIPRGSNEVMIGNVERSLGKAIFGLTDAGWSIESVGTPYVPLINEQSLAIRLGISAEVKLEKEQ